MVLFFSFGLPGIFLPSEFQTKDITSPCQAIHNVWRRGSKSTWGKWLVASGFPSQTEREFRSGSPATLSPDTYTWVCTHTGRCWFKHWGRHQASPPAWRWDPQRVFSFSCPHLFCISYSIFSKRIIQLHLCAVQVCVAGKGQVVVGRQVDRQMMVGQTPGREQHQQEKQAPPPYW